MAKKKELKAGVKAALAHVATGKCYSPDCTESLIVLRGGQPIINYQIAHIRDELAPQKETDDIGWRYWPADDMSQDERNQFDNLILLCSPCHKLIDTVSPRDFPSDLLHEWKQTCEQDFEQINNTGIANSENISDLVLESFGTIDQKQRYLDHDIKKFTDSSELLPESMFQEFLAELKNNHSYHVETLCTVNRYKEHFYEIGNNFIDRELDSTLHESVNAIDELTMFCACQFFPIERRTKSDHKYLQPDLNWDRNGDGSAQQRKRYDELTAKLNSLTDGAWNKYRQFRLAVQRVLAV